MGGRGREGMGANEGRSRTLVLYVFVLTVSSPNVTPGIPGPPDYRRGSRPELRQQHGEDVLRSFHAEQNERCLSVLTPRTVLKGVKRKDVPRTSHHPVQRGDASCFFFVVTVPAQFRAVPAHGYPRHHLRCEHRGRDCWRGAWVRVVSQPH